MAQIQFGDTVKDQVTGFQGIATGRAEYISGCSQVLLAPQVKKTGEMQESQWIDEQRLVVVKPSKIKLDNSKTPGPDKAAPKR